MATIADLQALGYACGYAHGSVEVEQEALAAAQQEANPGSIIEKAGQLTKATLEDLANAGRLPVTADQKQALAAKIGKAALEMVETHANEKVDFHQRALQIAKDSPDVWVIQQTVDVDGEDHPVAQLYVACKEDGTGWDDDNQAALDALADKPSYDERAWQVQNREAMAAARTLGATRPKLGADVFDLDGKQFDSKALIALVKKAGG